MLSLLLGPPILVAGLLCACAALGAQFGRVSDDWDMLSHFAPFYLAGGLGTLSAGLLLEGRALRPALMGVGLICVLLAGALIVPEYLRDSGPRAGPDAPAQLKLVQFNAWADRNQHLERSVAWIAAQKADVVVIQEPSVRLRQLMVAKTGMHVSCPYCDVMIFSRTRPVTTVTPPRPDNESGAPVARATFRDGRGDYTVLGVHYTWPTPGSRQQYEGRILSAVLKGFPKQSLVLAGDFNSTPWSFSRRREDRLFGLIRRTRALFSWPAGQASRHRLAVPAAFLPIDHVYAGSDWATVKVERGPRLGADHYPVIVTLARRAPT